MSRNVIHLSTECYPVAKAGGMGDVVGALPIYQSKLGWNATVLIPKYRLQWFENHPSKVIFSGVLDMEFEKYDYMIVEYQKTGFPFRFLALDIAHLYDRPSIYLNDDGHGYHDELQRNVALQRCVLDWLTQVKRLKYDMIHCHDHQVGLIPFMLKYCPQYKPIRSKPTFYTIHNGAYNTRMSWDRRFLLPEFSDSAQEYLTYNGDIDTVASVMYCADHINAVSPSYLDELSVSMPALQYNMSVESKRFSGILNRIDDEVWNPKTDDKLPVTMTRSWDSFKKANKRPLLQGLFRTEDVPLIGFIGRFAYQKGADLLIPAAERVLARFGFVNFYILGSGDKHLENQVQSFRDRFPERVACYIGYNEALAHQVYAASDFIVMPSRFEPCGLNQFFAMRYGALPIARKTGGLKDTVIDYEDGGAGIAFQYDSVDDLIQALSRGLHLYRDEKKFASVRKKATKQDYSWSKSAKIYLDIYEKLL